MAAVRVAVLAIGLLALMVASEQYEHESDTRGDDPKPDLSYEYDPNWNAHISSRGQLPDGTEKWGYVDTRKGAHQFYWLYNNHHGIDHGPLILWLQGGPGASSTGYGNFEIIGPLDLNLNEREWSWEHQASLLFIDNPVGAGYSYVDEPKYLTQTTKEITTDLITMIKVIMEEHPEFQKIPFYIFGQSYGGKMGADFGYDLYWEMKNGNVKVNLRGVAMGNAWIDPAGSTLSWAPMLYWMSILDEVGYNATNNMALNCVDACERARWQECTNYWRRTQVMVSLHSPNVDFYNILNYNSASSSSRAVQRIMERQRGKERQLPEAVIRNVIAPFAEDSLDSLMNGPIRVKLGIIPDEVIWGGQYGDVFLYQENDFMRPVVKAVGDILTHTDLQVIVYQGQLDLICDGKAAMDWVRMLNWDGLSDYLNAERFPVLDPTTGQTEAFYKRSGQLQYQWINNAGHPVPKDAGWPAYRMLERIIDSGATKRQVTITTILLSILGSCIARFL